MLKQYLTWDDVQQLCYDLYTKLQYQQYDKIIGITRGGAIPGVILSHLMGIKLYTIGLKTYNEEVQSDKVEIYGLDPVFYVNCKNKRILIVDDICDSGQSIVILKDLFSRCTTIPPQFATLHYKPTACIIPDYFAQETTKYIVYPWEAEAPKYLHGDIREVLQQNIA